MNAVQLQDSRLIAKDAATLAQMTADHLLAWAIEARGPVRIALSGGTTPRLAYKELVSPRIAHRFPWDRVHWFWSDERFVPPDHKDSNYHMAWGAMFNIAPVPPENIHPIPTEGLSPDEAAAAYEAELQRVYGCTHLQSNRPLFDICLLGLGDDGHTASLIPGEPVLAERGHWVAAVTHGRPEARITLTYPAINWSRRAVFLVSGESKRAMLHAVLSGKADVPASRVSPLGELLFFADRAAAEP